VKAIIAIKPIAEELEEQTEVPGEDPPIKFTTPRRIKPDAPGAQ
jgi:hypothetical protein